MRVNELLPARAPKLEAVSVAPLVPDQVNVTASPAITDAGVAVNVTVGADITVKVEALLAVPPGVVTESLPLLAPLGTAAVMEVALTTENVIAAVLLNLTAVAPVKLLPVIVTFCPIGPLAGVKDVMDGAGMTVKFVALLAVPPGVMMESLPLLAPLGTDAVMEVALTTVNVIAAVPLNLTAVTPVKLLPVIETLCPMGPLAGVKEVMDGAGTTVKFVALLAVPPGVVTESLPLLATLGTAADMEVALTTVNVIAGAPLNLTAVVPVKLLPVIVMFCPMDPLAGVKEVMEGVGMTVKLVALLAVPPGVVTESLPLLAPLGTDAVMEVALTKVNVIAGVPLNLTAVAPVKLLPVIVTFCPIGPLTGVKEVMDGAGMTVKFDALLAVPPGVVTESFPLLAPLGTDAVMEVALTTLNVVAAVPLNNTAVAPEKFVPVKYTLCPIAPLAGVKELIVGVT